jgi:hypothetical protein
MTKDDEVEYGFKTTYVQMPTSFIQDEFCNALVFTNEDQANNTVAVVKGKFLQPPTVGVVNGVGESIAIGGNKGEFFRGRIDINFNGAATGGRLSVVEKVYLTRKSNGWHK